MAIVKNNPMVQNTSGLVGDTVVYRKIRGQLQMANKPGKRKGKDSAKQIDVKNKFKFATQYAKRQIKIPEALALYATGTTQTMPSAYVVAVNDYLKPPVVKSINTVEYLGLIGDSIVVNAVDDFMVTKVKVVILTAAGSLVEQGEATPDPNQGNLWFYKATVANPTITGTTIKAIAYDRPGNTGSAQVVA